MKTLTNYHDLIKQSKQVPGLLAEIADEASADYAFYSEKLIAIRLKKASKWIEIKMKKDGEWRDKPISDKLTDQIWALEDDGKEEITLKYKLKALEKILSSIKSHIFVLNKEADNQI